MHEGSHHITAGRRPGRPRPRYTRLQATLWTHLKDHLTIHLMSSHGHCRLLYKSLYKSQIITYSVTLRYRLIEPNFSLKFNSGKLINQLLSVFPISVNKLVNIVTVVNWQVISRALAQCSSRNMKVYFIETNSCQKPQINNSFVKTGHNILTVCHKFYGRMEAVNRSRNIHIKSSIAFGWTHLRIHFG